MMSDLSNSVIHALDCLYEFSPISLPELIYLGVDTGVLSNLCDFQLASEIEISTDNDTRKSYVLTKHGRSHYELIFSWLS